MSMGYNRLFQFFLTEMVPTIFDTLLLAAGNFIESGVPDPSGSGEEVGFLGSGSCFERKERK
jgi:hypothetical protein